MGNGWGEKFLGKNRKKKREGKRGYPKNEDENQFFKNSSQRQRRTRGKKTTQIDAATPTIAGDYASRE